MSIAAYTGLPGSGKSYSLVKRVVMPALKGGRHVFLNVPLNDDWVSEKGYSEQVHYYTTEQLDQSWIDETFIKGSILIIDEMYTLWPAGVNVNKIAEHHKILLAQHRHMVGENGKSTEIIFACQDLAQVASFARNMVDTTYRMTKLTAVGANNSMRVDIYRGPVTGPQPPISKKLKSAVEKYDPEVFKAYKSHTMSETGDAGDETASDDRVNVLKGFVPIAFGLGLLLLTAFAWWTLSGFFTSSDEPVPVVEASDGLIAASYVPKPSTPSPAPPLPPVKKVETESSDLLADANVYINGITGFGPRDLSIRAILENGAHSDLGVPELRRLGYRLIVINVCAARLKSDTRDELIGCLPEDEKTTTEGEHPSVLRALGGERP